MRVVALLAVLSLTIGCATTIRPGEVGVRQAFGKLAEEVQPPGLVLHPPLAVTYIRVPVRTQNLEVQVDLPSSEGLNVNASVSILYGVMPEKSSVLMEKVGPDFENQLVLPVFRSAAADVSAKYAAKDMHSGMRSAIEAEIAYRMNQILDERGLKVEAVLLKSIRLPAGLYAAIEEKLSAEQAAQRMTFVLQAEEQEAARRRIEAEGIRDAQRILQEGLSPEVLHWRSIEAFAEMADSPGTRVIITDGSGPFLINPEPPAPAGPAR